MLKCNERPDHIGDAIYELMYVSSAGATLVLFESARLKSFLQSISLSLLKNNFNHTNEIIYYNFLPLTHKINKDFLNKKAKYNINRTKNLNNFKLLFKIST